MFLFITLRLVFVLKNTKKPNTDTIYPIKGLFSKQQSMKTRLDAIRNIFETRVFSQILSNKNLKMRCKKVLFY